MVRMVKKEIENVSKVDVNFATGLAVGLEMRGEPMTGLRMIEHGSKMPVRLESWKGERGSVVLDEDTGQRIHTTRLKGWY